MDHNQLIAELPQLEAMNVDLRLALGNEKRQQQLLRFLNCDRSCPINKREKKQSVVEYGSSIKLIGAVCNGDVDEVEQFLKASVDPNVHNEDSVTPLHLCAINNQENIARILMKYNPDVNAKDSELWTPLHAAAFCGNNEIVKLLIENGADLLAVNSERNMAFELCSAVDTLNIIEAEMAKRNITEEKIKEKRDERPKQMLEDMKLLQQKGEALDIRQYDGSTFLHAAAANGYSEVVAFLLSSGVEPNLKDIDGWTSLHAAAFWNQISIINLLCENGANVEDKTFAGETAYDLAQDDATRAAIKTIQKQNCSGMKMIESK